MLFIDHLNNVLCTHFGFRLFCFKLSLLWTSTYASTALLSYVARDGKTCKKSGILQRFSVPFIPVNTYSVLDG